MAELFNVVFAGEIAGRADPAAVRANVGKLFNASEAVLDKLFSGQPVIIKKMVDRTVAMELRARMKLAGANTRLVAVDEQGRPLPEGAAPSAPVAPAAAAPVAVKPAAPAPAPAAARPAPAVAPAAPAAQPRPAAPAPAPVARPQPAPAPVAARPAPAPAAPASAAGGGWGIAPVGATLAPPAGNPPPPPAAIPATVAAAGTDLISAAEKPVIKPVQVDISGISMAAVGSDVLRDEEKRKVTPVQVDISGITIAPPGADLEQLHDDKPPVNPDISHIKLA